MEGFNNIDGHFEQADFYMPELLLNELCLTVGNPPVRVDGVVGKVLAAEARVVIRYILAKSAQS